MSEMKKSGQKKKRINIVISLLLLLCFLVLILFFFKLPKRDATMGVNFTNDYHKEKLENGKVYTQRIDTELEGVHSFSVLFIRKGGKTLTGDLNMSVVDSQGKEVVKNTYDANDVSSILLITLQTIWLQSKGNTYYLNISTEDVTGGELYVASIKDQDNAFTYDNEKSDYKFVYYYTGVKEDRTYFWYPIMGIAFLTTLLVINSSKGDNNEEKK